MSRCTHKFFLAIIASLLQFLLLTVFLQLQTRITLSIMQHKLNSEAALGITSQQAYETQFFGFTPKSFTDGLYNAVTEYSHDALVGLAKELKTEFKQSPASEQELRISAENVYKEKLPAIGKAFDKLETYVFQNAFGIPSEVLLKEDHLRNIYPSADHNTVEQLEEQIQAEGKKIKAGRYVGACLRKEIADTEPLVAELRRIISDQKSLFANFQEISDVRESLNKRLHQQRELSNHSNASCHSDVKLDQTSD